MYYKYFLFIISLIINFTKQNSQDCLNYNDCYNCSISKVNNSNDCIWLNNTCSESYTSITHEFWWEAYNNCIDHPSKYCGIEGYSINNEKINITLPYFQNQYGTENIYCQYIVFNPKKSIDQIFSISIETFVNNSLISIDIYIVYADGTFSSYSVNQVNYSINVAKITSITFHYYSVVLFTIQPFIIIIDKPNEKHNYILYIVIGVIVIVCLFSSIGVFCISRKLALKRKRQREAIQYAQRHFNVDQLELKNSNQKKVEMLLKNDLKQIAYNPSNDLKNKSCTICCEEYTVFDSMITITKCSHVFHYNCLKSWLLKNVLSPKCPNCNNILIEIDNSKNIAKNDNNPLRISSFNIIMRFNQHNVNNERLNAPRVNILDISNYLRTNQASIIPGVQNTSLYNINSNERDRG